MHKLPVLQAVSVRVGIECVAFFCCARDITNFSEVSILHYFLQTVTTELTFENVNLCPGYCATPGAQRLPRSLPLACQRTRKTARVRAPPAPRMPHSQAAAPQRHRKSASRFCAAARHPAQGEIFWRDTGLQLCRTCAASSGKSSLHSRTRARAHTHLRRTWRPMRYAPLASSRMLQILKKSVA